MTNSKLWNSETAYSMANSEMRVNFYSGLYMSIIDSTSVILKQSEDRASNEYQQII